MSGTMGNQWMVSRCENCVEIGAHYREFLEHPEQLNGRKWYIVVALVFH